MKKLFFFSDYYNSEDLGELTRDFDVIFIPTNTGFEKNRDYDLKCDYGYINLLKSESGFKLWFQKMFYLDLLFFEEIGKTHLSFKKINYKNMWRIKAKKLKKWVENNYLFNDHDDLYFGSYWEEMGSLGIFYLKEVYDIKSFFKVKSDFDDDKYVPYSEKILKNMDKVCVLSEYEREVMYKKHTKFVDKIEIIKSR